MDSTKPIEPKKRFWTSRRMISTLVVLSLIAAFGISSCHSNDETKTAEKPGGPAAKAPNAPAKNAAPPAAALTALPASVRDAQLTGIDGASFKLADYQGKVVLVNLWATWCGPCRLETPELVKLHKEFKSQGVEMVGLTTENPQGAAESVKNFVRANGVDYRIGWASGEFALTLMQGRDAIPQSFVISRDGRIVKRFVGFSAAQTPPLLRQAIEEALNDKAKA
jgi:thiol-disulfide isomerase/thioredoxin